MEDLELKCNTIVVKIASRCNLNCTYCYMYNSGDNTWEKQPKVMSAETVQSLANRVKEHCKKHTIKNFNIVIHGGEPLLAGLNFFRNFVAVFNATLLPDTKPSFNLQTNATLLNEDWCKLLNQLNVSIGISLDGLKEDNDKYRIYHSGKGSYDDIIKGYRIAQNSVESKRRPGFLSVLNINADPIKTYEHFKELNTSIVDFLFPDANFESPLVESKNITSSTPYADWLITIFDIWIKEDQRTRTGIKIFELLIEIILGDNLYFEAFGIMHNDVLVIETDGGIEAVDTLKICGDGFTKAGANVSTHSFDDAIETPLAQMYIMAHKYLSQKCLACPISEVCGGGPVQTRYSKENGFNNPSIYCHDFLKLITHIQNAVIDALPIDFIAESELSKITYNDAINIINENMDIEVPSNYSTFISNF